MVRIFRRNKFSLKFVRKIIQNSSKKFNKYLIRNWSEKFGQKCSKKLVETIDHFLTNSRNWLEIGRKPNIDTCVTDPLVIY